MSSLIGWTINKTCINFYVLKSSHILQLLLIDQHFFQQVLLYASNPLRNDLSIYLSSRYYIIGLCINKCNNGAVPSEKSVDAFSDAVLLYNIQNVSNIHVM